MGTAMVAVVVVLLCVWLIPDRSNSDCTTVRQLIEFNQRHNEALAANSDPNEAPLSDYEAWAAQLGSYATTITDPQLAPHAKAVADLAGQTVIVVKESRDEAVQTPEPGPPQSAQKYAQVAVQFRNEITALNTACTV